MPITLPNLDDRTYDDLMQEARSLIPAHAPEWTNHNASDPGITLIELFAYLAEMLIYRLNRVTDANVYAFLKLIDEWERHSSPGGVIVKTRVGPGEQIETSTVPSLADDIRNVVLEELRRVNRAVTSKDFEELVLAEFKGEIARVRCVPRRNLVFEDPKLRSLDKPSSISVIIVPAADDSKPQPQPDKDMKEAVSEYLDERRLLTTRVHVVPPTYVEVGVQLTVVTNPDALVDDVKTQVETELKWFFNPLPDRPDEKGWPHKKGWPFGRNVFVSEIYELLDKLPGVDYVIRTVDSPPSKSLDELITADPTRLMYNSRGELMAVELFADELVSANILFADESAHLFEGRIRVLSPLKSSA
jgi:Baseplate J-like protein.